MNRGSSFPRLLGSAIGTQRLITDGAKQWRSNAAVHSRQPKGLRIGSPARSESTRYFKRPIPHGSLEQASHSSQERGQHGIHTPWVRPLLLRRAAAGRSVRADRLRKSVPGTSFGSHRREALAWRHTEHSHDPYCHSRTTKRQGSRLGGKSYG